MMKLISNVVLLATIVNINLYASSKDWENIDTLEKLGEIEESIKLKNQLIDTIKKDYLKQYPKKVVQRIVFIIKRFLAANWLQIDISFINFIFINERGKFSTTFSTLVLYFILGAFDMLLVAVIKKFCKISTSISFIDQTIRCF